MATHVPCKKNDASGYVFYVSLVSQADTKIFQANPTYAAGDIKVAVDDAAPGNVSAVAIDADFTKRVKITLSQAQTNGDNLTVICSDAAGAEWCDLTINIQTSAQTLDETDAVVDTAAADVVNIDGSAMIGTNNAALAATALSTVQWTNAIATALASYTAARAVYLDELAAANLPSDIDAILLDTDTTIPALIAALNNISTAQVNAEVVDALGVDTLAELAQAAPTATPTIKTALMLLYMIARNKLTTITTASGAELGIYDDAGTKIIKRVLSDDGLTFTEAEAISGA